MFTNKQDLPVGPISPPPVRGGHFCVGRIITLSACLIKLAWMDDGESKVTTQKKIKVWDFFRFFGGRGGGTCLWCRLAPGINLKAYSKRVTFVF